MRAAPLGCLLVLSLVLVTLSGCAGPPSDEPFLVTSLASGESLYAWSDEDYVTPAEARQRAVNADFEAPLGLEGLGVVFSGHLLTEDSWATLRVRNPDGGTLLLVNASVGAEDESGPIRDLFRFEEVRPLTVGQYSVRVEGRGTIGQLEFRVYGIDDDLDPKTVDFESDGRDFTVRAFADGVGDAPKLTVVDPDGGGTLLRFTSANGDVTRTIRGDAGTWNVLFDGSGWAGVVNIAIQPA